MLNFKEKLTANQLMDLRTESRIAGISVAWCSSISQCHLVYFSHCCKKCIFFIHLTFFCGGTSNNAFLHLSTLAWVLGHRQGSRMGTCTTSRQWLLVWREHHMKAANSFQKHQHPIPGALNTSELNAKCNPDKSTHRELENDGVFCSEWELAKEVSS